MFAARRHDSGPPLLVRAQHGATASRKSTLNPMTKRPFRLTYIDARRRNGVAGCVDVLRLARDAREVVRRERLRDPTEASRAIHGDYREPPTRDRGETRLRADRCPLLFGRPYRATRIRFQRPHFGRSAEGCGRRSHACLELHRGWSNYARDRNALQQARRDPIPTGRLDI